MEHHHEHEGEHTHLHEHEERDLLSGLRHTLTPHSHDYQAAALDAALATDRGIWAVKVPLVSLPSTAIFQVVIVMVGGSVALLADTIHNSSDASTAVPLGLAFTLSRRARIRALHTATGRQNMLRA